MPAATAAMQVGPGDDAAVLANGTTITADVLVEGVHFDDRLSADDVGWKVVAVSVSDLAAMGAKPDWGVLTLSLPRESMDWIAAFAAGFARAAGYYGVTLIGGDTTGSPGPRVVGLTLGGRLAARPLTRAGGRPGDTLWVTGVPGLAGAGWILDDPPDSALEALRRPMPPLDFALVLAQGNLATAAMDLSDGLAMDLPRLVTASGCGATLDPTTLPAHAALDGLPPEVARRCRLAGGDDYQLLFTTDPSHGAMVRKLADRQGIQVSAIGSLTAKPGISISDGTWPVGSFDHFAEGA